MSFTPVAAAATIWRAAGDNAASRGGASRRTGVPKIATQLLVGSRYRCEPDSAIMRQPRRPQWLRRGKE
jgi:hypothetical protein